MGLLSGITKAAGSLLGGDTLKDVKDYHWTTYICQVRKRLKLKQNFKNQAGCFQAQVSARWEAI